MNDYFVFIHAQKAHFAIDWMCRKLAVSRASYYRWTRPAGPSPTTVRHSQLADHLRRVFDAAKGKAGRDQIVHILAGEGIRIATGTAGSIMRELGLRAVRMRAWKKTTTADTEARTAHIVNHMLDAEGRRDLMPGASRYLRTGSGWLYLATVIDLRTPMVVGWSMASHMRASLIIDALAMARDHGHFNIAGGVIFHSDRGTQYTSGDFQKWCKTNHVTQSMGQVGTCWDNAVAECFFSHMKTEMFYQQHFANHLAARTSVMEYIEGWYNRRRPHSYNNGLTPAAALVAHQDRCQSAAA